MRGVEAERAGSRRHAGRREPAPARAREDARVTRQLRLMAVGCLLGIAVTHLLDVGHKFDEAPLIAALFVALIVAANLLALAFTVSRRLDRLWPLAALLAVAPFAAYLVSRVVGLPGIEDHAGHWADPVGTASLVFEAVLLGVSLASTRARAMRLAPSGAFLAAGLVAGGLMLGQSSDAHVGHGGHHGGDERAAAGGPGHGHAGGSSDGHAAGAADAGGGHGGGGHRHEGMNIDTATPVQRGQARDLLVRTTAGVAPYRSYDAARAAGFGFTMKSFDDQRDLDYWHLTHPAHLDDGRDLDPQRPESLMYWHPRDGRKPVLIAVVYRVPTVSPNPALGGPIVQWHLHRGAGGRPGRYKMTHLWLLPKLRDAYAMEMPAKRMSRRYGTPPDGRGTGL